MRRRSVLLLLFIFVLVLIALVSNFGPAERTLGVNVRSVYLHGAWVWTALVGIAAAALSGLVGLLTRRKQLQDWSIALGRTALLFWITYLPLSLWAMSLNWNGLFLDEPRWRIAFDFAIIGILVQLAIYLLKNSAYGSALNFLYGIAVAWSLSNADQVMHPDSPITSSNSDQIQLFFMSLTALCLLAGVLLASWLRIRAAETS
ncbi:MAG: hypothetical protein GTO18_03750 [Anaerolineales bacterium]|nr:hypothetical protein [Anaerolineales bacterium]